MHSRLISEIGKSGENVAEHFRRQFPCLAGLSITFLFTFVLYALIYCTLSLTGSLVLYWYCQVIILAGWLCMAHETGHGTLSSYSWVNHLIETAYREDPFSIDNLTDDNN